MHFICCLLRVMLLDIAKKPTNSRSSTGLARAEFANFIAFKAELLLEELLIFKGN